MSIQDVAWVLDFSSTTGHERLVLIAIANHTNRDDPWAELGYDRIGHEAKVSRSTAIRAVQLLEEQGAIAVRRSPGRTCNQYRILHPTVSDGHPPTVSATVSEPASNSVSCDTRISESLTNYPLPPPSGGRDQAEVATNPRARGANPRAKGTNPRALTQANERDEAARQLGRRLAGSVLRDEDEARGYFVDALAGDEPRVGMALEAWKEAQSELGEENKAS